MILFFYIFFIQNISKQQIFFMLLYILLNYFLNGKYAAIGCQSYFVLLSMIVVKNIIKQNFNKGNF